MKTISIYVVSLAFAASLCACGVAPESVSTSDDPLLTPQNGSGGNDLCVTGRYCVFTWPGTHDQYVAVCAPNPNGYTVCCGGCIDANGICQDGGSDMVCGALGNKCVSCAAGTNCNESHQCK